MKKIISLVILCALLLMVQISVLGEDTNNQGSSQRNVTFENLKDQLMKNNPTIQKLDMAEKQIQAEV